MDICRRRCRRANWWRLWRRCTKDRPCQRDTAAHASRSGQRLARSQRGPHRPRGGDPGLITQGKSNADVARLTYLSPNTVKSYIRSLYRKVGVESRTQAVLWGMQHGFLPDHSRIEHWRGGP